MVLTAVHHAQERAEVPPIPAKDLLSMGDGARFASRGFWDPCRSLFCTPARSQNQKVYNVETVLDAIIQHTELATYS